MNPEMILRICPKCGSKQSFTNPHYDANTETLKRICRCCGYEKIEPTKDKLRKPINDKE